MEGVHILSVSDLLRLSRPLSGAASLHFPSSSPLPPKRFKLEHPGPKPSRTHLLFSDPNPNPEVFSPIKHPVLLIGTVDLFPEDSDVYGECRSHCFSFSDGLATVCCSILDFDLKIVGREVQVLAWNFVPFKHRSGGVLEVIQWSLLASEVAFNDEPLLSIPSASSSQETHLVARASAFGILQSVSPIFSAPCEKRSGNQKIKSCGNPADGANFIGFLAEIATCMCSLCRSSSAVDRHKTCHSFTKPVFVYFLRPTSLWRPVLAKLVGKIVKVSGLKWKSIFVGGEESYVMLVSTAKTVVRLSRLPVEVLPLVTRVMDPRKNDDGVYKGVVTGVFMHGMAIELDGKVWLMVTDPQLAPQHSLRVGAVVCVRNYHLVQTKYSRIGVVLIATCARTNIDISLFSLSETRYYSRSQNESLLGRCIESLTFSTRFWVLLLVSCFKSKFGKTFSNKEIMGSKMKEGLVQIYATKYLPSNVCKSQFGMFMEFCKHEWCTRRIESNSAPILLAIPLSNLISTCEAIWVSILSKIENNAETVGSNYYFDHYLCEGTSDPYMIRRIISSEELGFVLLGALKISPSSGRLQLVDASGSVDVVVPDLLTEVNDQAIHEVKDYNIVMEGLQTQHDEMQQHFDEPLSCRSIFQQISYEKKSIQFTVYVHFYLRDSSVLDIPSPIPSCMSRVDDIKGTSYGKFHLLRITHKFPANDNLQNEENKSSILALFAEAFVLPYNLMFEENNEYIPVAKDFGDKPKLKPVDVDHLKGLDRECSIQPLIFHASRSLLTGTSDSSNELRSRLCHIPCRLTFRGTKRSGFLVNAEDGALNDICDSGAASSILLEFKSDSFSKYQLLRLGGLYILKCSPKALLCNSEGCECFVHGKASMNSQTLLWSLSFCFGEIMHRNKLPEDHSAGFSLVKVGEISSRTSPQNEVVFQQSLDQIHRVSDVHMHLSPGPSGALKEEIEALELGLTRLLTSGEILSVSSCIQIMMDKLTRPFGVADLQSSNLPQGKLISLGGNIENVHFYDQKFNCYAGSACAASRSQQRVYNICIHVNDDNHMVRIRGIINKCAYPIGMGPGANATFHRVLMMCTSNRQPELVLTPVSFVVINSVKEVSYEQSKERSVPRTRLNILDEDFLNMISSGLISQFTQQLNFKLVQLHCRVVAIHTLVLEIHAHAIAKTQSSGCFKMPAVKIPLAGFVLDDGSSLCCCWADDGHAKALLRLCETARLDFFSGHQISAWTGSRKYQCTTGYHLEKMLKRHRRIIIKNNQSPPDLSCQDLTFSFYSDQGFSYSEEKLLRFIILNACVGSIFNVIGNIMDSNALKWVDAELLGMQSAVPWMLKNLWVREIGYVNPLKEAKIMLHDLLMG